MENRLEQKQVQGIALTATMQQSLNILRMSNDELTELLSAEAERNPFLRLARSRGAQAPEGSGLPEGLDPVAAGPSLHEHVMSQIRTEFRNPLDRSVALHFAQALASSGWLEGDFARLCAEIRCPPARGEAVLARLQQFEPAGLFARSLAECLRLQAREAGFLDAPFERLLDNLAVVASGDREALAARCGVPAVEVLILLRKMRSLDPKPGLRFWVGADTAPPPDLVLSGRAGEWKIEVNESAFPAIRLQVEDEKTLASCASAALQAALSQARFLEGALSRRKATLLHIASCIIRRQSGYLDGGELMLQPMTLGDISDECELHVSTISRAISGAVIETPRGRMPLKALFSRSAASATGGQVSRASMGEVIRQIVGNEDRRKPLSDHQIVAALARLGYEIKRRTVANYRRELGIPAAGERRILSLPARPRAAFAQVPRAIARAEARR